MRWLAWTIVVAAAVGSAVAARTVSLATSNHYDEPLHCRAGCIYIDGRGLDANDGPFDPLAGITSVANAGWMRVRGFPSTRGPEPVARDALLVAREVNHAAGALLVLVLAAIAARWWGAWAAAVAAVSAAASPTLLTHASIVSPDLHTALLSLVAAILLYRWLAVPRIATAIAFGIVIGVGVATKLFVLVIPAAGLVLLALRRRWLPDAAPQPPARWARGIALALGVTVATAWATHAWTGLGEPDAPLGAAVGHWERILEVAEGKHKPRTYFAGRVERSHHWFVPAMLALKVPLALTLAALVALVAWRRWNRGPRAARGFVFAAWLAFAYVAAVWLGRSQLGIRHALPALLVLPLALASLTAVRARGRAWLQGAAACMVVWVVIGTARVLPFPIAYGNELAGGPDGVHRWFVDSQLDWGQAFLALRDWVDEHPEARPLKLAYFGSCSPTRFGIDAEILPSPLTPDFDEPPDEAALPDDVRGWIAISETTLKGTYARQCGQQTDYYRALESEPVVARIGHAIRIIRR